MKLKTIFLLFFIFAGFSVFAQESSSVEAKEKKLDVGDLIIEHVSDSYEWHITKIGHTDIYIPLPVILHTKDQGWVVFMSNKLHNPEHKYKNFVISKDDPIYKGKIMEILPDGTKVRPFDISLSKDVFALFLVSAFLLWLFISIANRYKKNPDKAPKGLQSLFEPLIIFVKDDISKSIIGEEKYEKYTPYLLTIFFFIFINNIMGLVPIFPGGYNLTGNITVTMVLAIFTFVITTISGTKYYWQEIFWSPVVPWWLKVPIPLMPIVEIVGVFTKPFVLMVRLFANMIGGHIVMLAFFSLIFIFGTINLAAGYGVSIISIAFTVFDLFLEMLVAFIQAYVFTLLSAIYFSMALQKEH
jgi:F-type H+-transporting ATPase subunit a